MPQSFASVHVHVVFSTKGRVALISDDLAPRLYEYIGGIVRARHSLLVQAGGMADHIHLLVSLHRQLSVAELLRDIKANSSKWVHQTFADRRAFAWQAGYAVFAVSFSNLDAVKGYIAEQAEHHRTRTFQDEFRALLRRHHIAFDERYMWD